jgi:hypothetical protein
MLINNQPINPFNEISDKILNAVLCYQLTHTYKVQCGMYQPIKRLTNNKNDKTTTTHISTLALSFDILTSIGEIFYREAVYEKGKLTQIGLCKYKLFNNFKYTL